MSKKAKEITKFEIGSKYQMSFIGDSTLRPLFECIEKTEVMATLRSCENDTEKLSRKIKIDEDGEYIVAGVYSMAPRIHSKRIAK